MFEFMLRVSPNLLYLTKQQEKVNPEKLAYDRPSPKLLGFLAKHYGLKGFSPQANNFVVFDRYFQGSGIGLQS